MTTELIETLAAFDTYVAELQSHNWQCQKREAPLNQKWPAHMSKAKELQEIAKADASQGNYLQRAYWAFTSWAYAHNDADTRDQAVQHIRNELAIEATTHLINPSLEE